jgi:hypothetical protein
LVLGGPAFIAYGELPGFKLVPGPKPSDPPVPDYSDVPSSLAPFPLSTLGSKAWVYVHDEPRTETMGEVASKLAHWRKGAPSVRRMLTSNHERDMWILENIKILSTSFACHAVKC